MFFNSAAYVWAWMVMILLCVAGSDVNSPHLHSGKLTPFDGNRINLSLNIEEERKLAAEGVLIRKTVSGNGGRGIVVQDVNASTSACMRAIKSVDAYKGLVPHIIAVEVYGSDVEADVSKTWSAHVPFLNCARCVGVILHRGLNTFGPR